MTQNKPLLNSNIRWFLAGMILANIAGQMAYSTLSLYMLDLGANVAQVGLVYTVASLVPLALQIFGGWLSDTIGRLRVIAFGSSVAVIGYFIFSVAPSWEWIMLGLSVEFVSNSVVGPSFNAYISEQSDESQRGRVYGLTSSIYMTVTVIGPALAGFIAYRFGFKPMMSVAFVFYLSATLLRIWMATREHFEKKGAELPRFSDFKIQLKAIFGTTAKVTIACQFASTEHFAAYRQIWVERLPYTSLAQIWLYSSGFQESQKVSFAVLQFLRFYFQAAS